jgi:hypothetical protein
MQLHEIDWMGAHASWNFAGEFADRLIFWTCGNDMLRELTNQTRCRWFPPPAKDVLKDCPVCAADVSLGHVPRAGTPLLHMSLVAAPWP